MKKMLIIGGAGFIGINAARHFAGKGWDVAIFDSLVRPGTDQNLKWAKSDKVKFRFIRGDIRHDKALLEKEVAKVDAVLHLAAQVAVTTSVLDPENDFLVNAYGTLNVLEAVRKSKNKPVLLFSSTNKVYGSLHGLSVVEEKNRYVFKDKKAKAKGVDEQAQLDFHSPYGCSKGAADQYVIDYSRLYGLKTVVFRQSCIYGEYQFGVEDQGWVAWFVIAANMGQPITIFGNGKQVRDLLQVRDLVRLYDLALKNISKVSGQAFNIGGGTGNAVSLVEGLQMIEDRLHKKITLKYKAVRAGDQPIFVSDNSKAKAMLGWEPKISIKDGLSELVKWVKIHEATLNSVRKSLVSK